ncbi:MAG: PrsW family intramembrane metalloprotease [Chloroflexota bacterium]
MDIIAVVVVASLLALVPTIFYALLIWWLDRHEKEPLPLLLVAFLWGAVPAILIAVILEVVVGIPLEQLVTSESGRVLTSASIVAPIVEEGVKAVILVVLFAAFGREFDNVLDGVVYGAMVGLGFALVENVLYLTTAASEGGLGGMVTLWVLRSGLFGLNHSMFTAFTGAALGWARSLKGPASGIVPVLGLLAAMSFHAIHNYLSSLVGLNSNPDDTLSIIGSCLAVIASDWIGILLIVVVAVASGNRESHVIRDMLAEEVTLGRLTPDEYETLVSGRLRWTTRWTVLFSSGIRRWRQLGKFFDLNTELAFRKDRMYAGSRKHQDRSAQDVAKLRGDIDRLKMTILSGS